MDRPNPSMILGLWFRVIAIMRLGNEKPNDIVRLGSLSEGDVMVGLDLPNLSPLQCHQWMVQGGRTEALGEWSELLIF